jgi:hypothetical protein
VSFPAFLAEYQPPYAAVAAIGLGLLMAVLVGRSWYRRKHHPLYRPSDPPDHS